MTLPVACRYARGSGDRGQTPTTPLRRGPSGRAPTEDSSLAPHISLRPAFLVESLVVLTLSTLLLAPTSRAEDCNSNTIEDSCDIDCGPPDGPCEVPGCGQSADCDTNVIPDECEDDFDNDEVINACDDCPDTLPGWPVNDDGCPLPPMWQSIKLHGTGSSALPFDYLAADLDPTAEFLVGPGFPTTSVEARRFDAPGKELEDFVVITFDRDISGYHQPGNVQLDVSTSNTFTTGTIMLMDEVIGGMTSNELILELEMVGETKAFEAYCVVIDLSASLPGLVAHQVDLDCKFRVQYGNVAGGTPPDYSTSLIDYAQIKGNNGTNVVNPLNPTYAREDNRFDWNLDGTINLIDAAEIKGTDSHLFDGCP